MVPFNSSTKRLSFRTSIWAINKLSFGVNLPTTVQSNKFRAVLYTQPKPQWLLCSLLSIKGDKMKEVTGNNGELFLISVKQ
jgi:hypothetical protein